MNFFSLQVSANRKSKFTHSIWYVEKPRIPIFHISHLTSKHLIRIAFYFFHFLLSLLSPIIWNVIIHRYIIINTFNYILFTLFLRTKWRKINGGCSSSVRDDIRNATAQRKLIIEIRKKTIAVLCSASACPPQPISQRRNQMHSEQIHTHIRTQSPAHMHQMLTTVLRKSATICFTKITRAHTNTCPLRGKKRTQALDVELKIRRLVSALSVCRHRVIGTQPPHAANWNPSNPPSW